MKDFLKSVEFDKNSVLKMMIFKYLMDFSDYYTEKDLIMLNTIFSICDTKYEGYICTDKLFDIFEENDVFFKQEDRAYFLKVESFRGVIGLIPNKI